MNKQILKPGLSTMIVGEPTPSYFTAAPSLECSMADKQHRANIYALGKRSEFQ
jgi:hypothetical protein